MPPVRALWAWITVWRFLKMVLIETLIRTPILRFIPLRTLLPNCVGLRFKDRSFGMCASRFAVGFGVA